MRFHITSIHNIQEVTFCSDVYEHHQQIDDFHYRAVETCIVAVAMDDRPKHPENPRPHNSAVISPCP